MLADDQRTREAALLLGQLRGQDALRPAALHRVLGDQGALAVAVLGDDEQLGVVLGDIHRQHPVLDAVDLAGDVHPLHSAGVPSHRPHVLLGEARGVP